MVNSEKLQEIIGFKAFTEEHLAEKLGVAPQIFCKKMEGVGRFFTIKEANLLAELLEMNGEEAAKIFFHKSRI